MNVVERRVRWWVLKTEGEWGLMIFGQLGLINLRVKPDNATKSQSGFDRLLFSKYHLHCLSLSFGLMKTICTPPMGLNERVGIRGKKTFGVTFHTHLHILDIKKTRDK